MCNRLFRWYTDLVLRTTSLRSLPVEKHKQSCHSYPELGGGSGISVFMLLFYSITLMGWCQAIDWKLISVSHFIIALSKFTMWLSYVCTLNDCLYHFMIIAVKSMWLQPSRNPKSLCNLQKLVQYPKIHLFC